jgi:subtilisin family serine protease
VIDIIKQVPIIEFIEEDVNVSIQQGPKGYFNFDSSATDIQINPSWGLDRVSHRETGFEGRYIYPKDAGQDVDIYIADTGVRIDHDDLKGRAIFGVSYSNDGDEDRQGHGTHVAAIAAGTTFGIAKKANIISVKVLNNKGAGPASAVIKGIEWIIRRAKTTGRRSVVNLSLGGGQVSNALNAVVAAAVAQDIVFKSRKRCL